MTKVLVVVDMQVDFISGALAAENGPQIVDGVIEAVKKFDGSVFYTLDTHYDNYAETQEGRNLPVPHCTKESEGWSLPSALKVALESRNAVGFEKPSFGSPDLVTHLTKLNESEGLEEITLIGICTDICVLTNAISLKCFLPEVRISVDPKLCAGVTNDRHNVALEAMRFCQIHIAE